MDPLKKEFVNRLKAVGWTQAEAARQLRVTSGAVNQIINPNSPVRPSLTTLRLFELVASGSRSKGQGKSSPTRRWRAAPGLTDREKDLLFALRRVPEKSQPEAVAALIAVVTAFQSKSSSGKVAPKSRSL
jgi:hypothetical protein